MEKTLQLATEFEPWIVDLRRHFHMHPELSMEEFDTTDRVAQELDKMGIPYQRFPGVTGLIAKIEGGKPGKTVALRSDMDALNVTEKNDVPYKSQVEGKMHACGHDAHTAMNLGAARILNDMKDELHGNVVFIFQPGEEIAEGAKRLIEAGDWLDEVDNVFGTHVWSNLQSGAISVEAGPRMASADCFTINITGKSGHGAQPQQCIDATVVAAAMVMNLQTIPSRRTEPTDPIVVTVGELHSGTRFNIISGSAVLDGTVRYFSNRWLENIDEEMDKIVQSTAATFGAEATLDYRHMTYPVVNDPESSKLAAAAVTKLFGADAVQDFPKTTGGEDFSQFTRHKPGVFVFLGCGNPELKTDVAHHNECFNVDESVLKNGSALYAQYAIDFLNAQV